MLKALVKSSGEHMQVVRWRTFALSGSGLRGFLESAQISVLKAGFAQILLFDFTIVGLTTYL